MTASSAGASARSDLRTLPNGKGHGWRKEGPKPSDYVFSEHFTRVAVDPIVALKTLGAIPAVRDQKSIGSCTGHGTTGCMMYGLRTRPTPVTDDLSALFAYYIGRQREHTVASDSGCEIRDVVDQLASLGCAPLADAPYVVSKFKKKPSPKAFKDALRFDGFKRYKLASVDDVIQALVQDMPVVGGFVCFASIDSADTTRTGVIELPKPKEKSVGGHCVWFVKADQPSRMFTLQNSWGTDWGTTYAGSRGYGLLPFAYLEQRLADDFWALDLRSAA